MGVKFPFKKVTYCNIGNPQQLNQKPITFFRQVIRTNIVKCLTSNSILGNGIVRNEGLVK
jgi:hypothetical protein